MNKDCGNPAVKEIEHAIIHSLKSHSQFVDIVPQVVRLRTAQFMPQIPQPLNTNAAFILGSGGETVQPIEHGNGTGVLLMKLLGAKLRGILRNSPKPFHLLAKATEGSLTFILAASCEVFGEGE